MLIRKFRIVVLILVSAVLCYSYKAEGQTRDSTALKEGSWALQFGIAQNFTLTSFQGSTIGAKYQLSENNAIRGGITINGSNSSGPTSYSASIGDSSLGTVPGNSPSKYYNVSFVLQYLWYMNPEGHVHLYAGAGPMFTYINSTYANNYSNYETTAPGYWYTQIMTRQSATRAVGVSAVLGVEWFACDWLSLRADYNENIQYQWNSSSSNTDYTISIPSTNYPLNVSSAQSTKGWTLGNSGVSFGLNIYL